MYRFNNICSINHSSNRFWIFKVVREILSYSDDHTLRLWSSKGQILYTLNLSLESFRIHNIKESFLIGKMEENIFIYNIYFGNKKSYFFKIGWDCK